MSAKQFGFSFGNSDPRTYTGMSPTFIYFFNMATGATLTSPAITESFTGSGIYTFSYTPVQNTSVAYLIDGGVSTAPFRYIANSLDPIQNIDSQIGFVADSFGATSIDPTSIMGYLRRNLEFLEGNATYNKTTGIWDIYSRGSSTLLREKTLTNSSTSNTKT